MPDGTGPQQHFWQRLPVFILIFMIGAGIGGAAMRVSLQPQPTESVNNQPIREDEPLPLISPLLACNFGKEIQSGEPGPNKNDLKKAANDALSVGNADTVSIYYRDLTNGNWSSTSGKELYAPASLFKVAYMMLVYKLAEDDPSLLHKQLKPVPPDTSIVQYFTPASTLNASSTYSVDDLVGHMIIDSDNQAMETLFTAVPEDKLNVLYDQLHITLPQHPNDDFVTTRNYSLFFRILYNASYLSERDSEKALELLVRSTFRQGLVAWLPSSIQVANKFGERLDTSTGQHQLHDCGIVYAPTHPYLICVMTKGKDFDRLANVIASVSQMVYDKVTGDVSQDPGQ